MPAITWWSWCSMGIRPLRAAVSRVLVGRERLARTPLASALVTGTAAFILLRPLLGGLHELTVVLLASLLRTLTDAAWWNDIVGQLPVDPVYTIALVRFAGEIQVRGLALPSPLGSALHSLAPQLFEDSALTVGGWSSAVLDSGSTVLGRGLVGFGADAVSLTLGLALFVIGLAGRPWLTVCGALQQAHVVFHRLFDVPLSLADLEAAGLPFAISSLISPAVQRTPWLTNELANFPAPVVEIVTGALLALSAYAVALTVLAPALAAWTISRRRGARQRSPARLTEVGVRGPLARSAAAVLLVALSPLGGFAEVETRVLPGAAPGLATADFPHASGPPAWTPDSGSPSSASRVSFIGQEYQFSLVVNGVTTYVRGMGYNPRYAGLDRDERAWRYDRDFGQLRAVGVNVIFGWFESEFDGLTLDKAYEYGLGVGMPYELNQDLNYDDPALRARLTDDMLRTVARHKAHPAVWFWTPANEVIHRLIFPSWLKREPNPLSEARATSFAQFYVELIDQIHALDPDHPVIYRDAEEVYLRRIRDALRARERPRPWFAYGANVYTRRLAEILRGWPRQGIDAPLLVSEFAPGGTGPSERPEAFRAMWSLIRSYPNYVIGGAVYAWTSEGPEELDRVFGLVDGTGRPRDDSLATITTLYGGRGAGS